MNHEKELGEELIRLYAEELDIITACYERMGKLLDKERIRVRIEELDISELYIYGGGYLGIQFYNAIKDNVHVISIVDKSKHLCVEKHDIKVIDIESFQKNYQNQEIVITPIKHYAEIYDELVRFVPENKILFLEDF